MSGVHGVTVVEAPLREGLQRECQAILGWEGSGFPGSQPVSMDQKNIALLEQKKYRVSWKADGTRYVRIAIISLSALITPHWKQL